MVKEGFIVVLRKRKSKSKIVRKEVILPVGSGADRWREMVMVRVRVLEQRESDRERGEGGMLL